MPEDKAVPLDSIQFRIRVKALYCKQAGCDCAPDTADTMASKSVKRIIVAEFRLNNRDKEVADRADQSTDYNRCPNRNETSSWGDRNKADDNTS